MIQFHELPAAARYYGQPALENAVGYIPMFLWESDPRSAKEQIHDRYVAGWNDFQGFRRGSTSIELIDTQTEDLFNLKYPGDPELPPLAYTKLRNELIVVYPSAWVAIVQPDGSFEVARLD